MRSMFSYIKTLLGAVLLSALLLQPSVMLAAALGEISVQSAIGQRLSAEIDIVALSKNDADTFSLRLAPAEAYKEASMTSPPSVFERALADPTNFDLHITSEEGLDWDNFEMHPVYTVYEIGSDGKYGDYEVVYNYADIEDIVDAFEKKNPQGIKDKR